MHSEAASTLKDNNLDHGSTSEMITAWKCDLCLKEHFSRCTEKHRQLHQLHFRCRGSPARIFIKNKNKNILCNDSGCVKERGCRWDVSSHTAQEITSLDQSRDIPAGEQNTDTARCEYAYEMRRMRGARSQKASREES